jgi:large subunit ribosomal protein L10
MLHGLKKSSKNLEKLEEYISGSCGLLFSNMRPFALFKLIKANRAPAFAKVGEIAPEDIVIPAGPTQIPPGPAISSLQKIGLKTRVEGGKISIIEPKTICKAGQPITEDMVAVFALLKIAPLKKGIEVLALWEDGSIYSKDVLDINMDAYIAELEKCVNSALNLAVNTNYPTSESVPFLLRKAYDEACALCIQSGFIEKDFASRVIAVAMMAAEALAQNKV